MKKNYFLTLILTLFSLISFGQSVVITGYVDSGCPSVAGRTVEMYVDGTIDFTDWNLVRQSNGGGFTASLSLTNLGTVSNAFVYITNSSTTLNSEFGISTNVIEDSGISSNGDDGFQVVDNNATVIDRFGEDLVDGSGTAWEHVDTYFYRKDGATPNGGSFDATNWVFGALNLLDGEGLCNTANALSSLVPFGSYTAIASTDPEVFLTGSIDSLDYYEGNGPSDEDTFTVSGTNLTNDLTVSVPTNFEISLTSGSGFGTSLVLTPSAGEINATTFYVRLVSGLTQNTYSGNITTSSTGADNESLSVSGVVSPADPQLTVSAFLNDFNYTVNQGPSNEDDFTVSGLFLTSDVVITAPSNFEISLTSGSNYTSSITLIPTLGTIEATSIFIRLQSGLAINSYSGAITFNVSDISQNDILINGNVFGAPTNSLIITGAYDATLTGGTPKGIELYAINDIADLSLFGISSVTNGGGSEGLAEYNFPADAISAGTFIYLSTESTNFNTFFGFDPTYTDGVVGINGDDAIELYENGQIIDTFGDVDMDGTGEAWEYLDGWAYRNSNTGPDGTVFTVSDWSYSGADAFEGEAINSAAATPFPIGTYTTTTASTIENQIEGFGVYPNPVIEQNITISSASSSEKIVTIFNTLGKEVLSTKVSGSQSDINVSGISSGLYILSVIEEGKIATQKIIIE